MGCTPILRTVAGPRAFEETAAALDRQWSLHDHIPDTICLQIGIAVGEILANIVEHGSAGRHLVQIEVHFSTEPGRVSVVLVDDGNVSGVDVQAAAMPDDAAERGRGLAMANAVLGGISYERRADSNYWTLTSKPF